MFYKIVENIKLHEITSDDILDYVNEIRSIFVKAWRPEQHSMTSGIILWGMLIIFGILLIVTTYFQFDPELIVSDIFVVRFLGACMIGVSWSLLIFSTLIIQKQKRYIVSGLFAFAELIILAIMVIFLFSIPQIDSVWITLGIFWGWFLINAGIHNLGHYVAGKIVGIDFESWVTNKMLGQWAIIIDYKSYLKASFNKRQILHLAGPICTQVAPWVVFFITLNPLMLIVAIGMGIHASDAAVRKITDFKRIFNERKLKKEYKKIKTKF
jgi:hypothetical protein